MVNLSFTIILIGLALLVSGWALARSAFTAHSAMRVVPWCLFAAGAAIALSRLPSIDPGWKLVTLAVVSGTTVLAILDIRRRREKDYHTQHPVFVSKPIRSIICLDGSLRQFYLCKSPAGFLVGSDLLEVSSFSSMKRQILYRQSRCKTVFPDHAAAKKVLHDLIDSVLRSSAGFGQAPVRCLSTADGAAYRLHLAPADPVDPRLAGREQPAGSPIEPRSVSSLPDEVDVDDLIERSANLHKQLLAQLAGPRETEPLEGGPRSPPTRSTTPFVISITRDTVQDGLTQTLQIQLPEAFADAEAAWQGLNATFLRLRQRDPVFANSPLRSLRAPDGTTVQFHLGEESGAYVIGMERETGNALSDPVRQVHLPSRHAHRSAAEAEVLAHFESHRRSEPLFATAPLRMILSPDGCHYRGHLGEVSSGYRAGIEFDMGEGHTPLTCQSVVEIIYPDCDAAEEGLASEFDKARQNHPVFSTAPMRSIYLTTGTVIHLHVSALPEESDEPARSTDSTGPCTDKGASTTEYKSYLQHQQRALLSQFEGYRQEHQLTQSQEGANSAPYDLRFAIGIERNTVEGGMVLAVQTTMPDYSYSWSAQTDLQAMSKRLLHNNPLFSETPFRSIRTPNGTIHHLHIGSLSDAFVAGVESHIVNGSTTIIRQQELPEAQLDRPAAEQYLLSFFEAYRQAESVFSADPPVRSITAPDGTHYRFYIAEVNGKYRVGVEHDVTAELLHQTLLEQVFADFNTAEIETYRVRAKD